MRPLTDVHHVILHTTAGSWDATVDDVRRYHVEHRGWSDIGYHYLVGADGTVSRGRDVRWQGAHAKGHNGHSIGVAMIGDHDDRAPTDLQMDATLGLLALLCRRHDLTHDAVIGHRETGARKSCPGRQVDPWAIRALVRERMAQHGSLAWVAEVAYDVVYGDAESARPA